MPFAACTNKISDTLNWCAAFILNRPSSGVAAIANEPGLTNANLILSTVLAPPFGWQWNRNSATFSTVIGQADYVVAATDFGWLEKATISLNTMVPPVVELQLVSLMTAAGENERPFNISVVNDDNAGNITFRLMSVPDAVYTVTLTYQKAPVRITALSQLWSPIPDKYNFLYERAMLAQLHAMYDSTTYLQEMELFLRQLVGASEGLSESARAIFLEERLSQLRTEVATQSATTASPRRAQ